MNINKDRLLSIFSALVAIDSPSYGERKVGDYITARLSALGFSVQEDDAAARYGGNCGNIHGYWQKEGGISAAPLLFCCHMDTVEPSCGKEAVIGNDGMIRSNGKTVLGADDFAGITAILEALSVIKEERLPHRPLEVLFTIAEEQHCKGTAAFDFSKLKAKEAYVFDLTGPVGAAAYKAPSIFTFNITVTGKAAHAGFAPQDGIHAIQAAAKAIASLDLGWQDEETVLSIGIIEGGLATNIVPETCIIKGEIRSYVPEKTASTAKHVIQQFSDAAAALGAQISVETETHYKAYEIPKDHSVVQRFAEACRVQGLPSSLLATFGGSDNNHLAEHGIAGLVVANAMFQCHSCEEYTTVGELTRAAQLALALMLSPQ